MWKSGLFIMILSLLPLASKGVTLQVPQDYPVIQQAIDAASELDTVLIADGIYTGEENKNLNFNGCNIVVMSENGPENCIIDCQGSGRGLKFESGETAASTLRGLTIRFGNSFPGGGIYIANSRPTIVRCIICYCDGQCFQGGGIYISNGDPSITHCTMVGNRAKYGGAIYFEYSNTVIKNNIIAANEVVGLGCHGSGIYCSSGTPDISYNDVWNEGDNFYGSATPFCAGQITQVNHLGDFCDPHFNIMMDPLFESGTFRLTGESHCINAGDPSTHFDPDSTIADMGALYFITQTCLVELIPFGTPITVPASGGSFSFEMTIENIIDTTTVIDVWTEIVMPSDSIVGPILMRRDVSLETGTSISRTFVQYIPGNAPAGYYLYRAKAGFSPELPFTEDAFVFGKEPGGDCSPTQGDWNITGWERPAGDTDQIDMEYGVLHSCFPNPFNPVTAISYQLSANSFVNLSVYDISGRLVAELINGRREAGSHSLTFDASHLSSGIYFYRVQAGDFTASGKMVLVK